MGLGLDEMTKHASRAIAKIVLLCCFDLSRSVNLDRSGHLSGFAG